MNHSSVKSLTLYTEMTTTWTTPLSNLQLFIQKWQQHEPLLRQIFNSLHRNDNNMNHSSVKSSTLYTEMTTTWTTPLSNLQLFTQKWQQHEPLLRQIFNSLHRNDNNMNHSSVKSSTLYTVMTTTWTTPLSNLQLFTQKWHQHEPLLRQIFNSLHSNDINMNHSSVKSF